MEQSHISTDNIDESFGALKTIYNAYEGVVPGNIFVPQIYNGNVLHINQIPQPLEASDLCQFVGLVICYCSGLLPHDSKNFSFKLMSIDDLNDLHNKLCSMPYLRSMHGGGRCPVISDRITLIEHELRLCDKTCKTDMEKYLNETDLNGGDLNDIKKSIKEILYKKTFYEANDKYNILLSTLTNLIKWGDITYDRASNILADFNSTSINYEPCDPYESILYGKYYQEESKEQITLTWQELLCGAVLSHDKERAMVLLNNDLTKLHDQKDIIIYMLKDCSIYTNEEITMLANMIKYDPQYFKSAKTLIEGPCAESEAYMNANYEPAYRQINILDKAAAIRLINLPSFTSLFKLGMADYIEIIMEHSQRPFNLIAHIFNINCIFVNSEHKLSKKVVLAIFNAMPARKKCSSSLLSILKIIYMMRPHLSNDQIMTVITKLLPAN